MNNSNNEIWVFLSHSNKDYEKVRQVRNMLEEENLRPLMFFLRCLNDDDEIDDLIKREIDCRTRFILCDSDEARKSKWVQREASYIESKDRNFDVIDLTASEDEIHRQVEQIKKKATIFISYNRDEFQLAEKVYDRLSKYDFDIKFDRYFLRSGMNFALENMISVDEACKKGTVIALLKDRILTDGSFAKTELGRALKNDQSQSEYSILPFYLDKRLEEKLGEDNKLRCLLKYQSTDLTRYAQDERADIVVNEVLKRHYRPGTILFYSNLFANPNEDCYDKVESEKLNKLYCQITRNKLPFWRRLFK